MTTDRMDVQLDPGAGKRAAEAPPSPDTDRGRSSQKRRDSTADVTGSAAVPASLEHTHASMARVEVDRVRALASTEIDRLTRDLAEARAQVLAASGELATARAQRNVLMTSAQEQVQGIGLQVSAMKDTKLDDDVMIEACERRITETERKLANAELQCSYLNQRSIAQVAEKDEALRRLVASSTKFMKKRARLHDRSAVD
mgnify:CR=1 FL=1